METGTRIFRAARRLFDDKGLENLSLRGVAKTVGITPMAIYRHFASKEALVDALVLDGLAQWSARVDFTNQFWNIDPQTLTPITLGVGVAYHIGARTDRVQ